MADHDDPYSAGQNFGYASTPGYASQFSAAFRDRYYSGGGPIPTWTPTSWDEHTIETIAAMLANIHDGHFQGAATTWKMIVDQLTGMKQAMQQAGTNLLPAWDPAKSEAASNFFRHVGASTWSLDEWITFGTQNQQALEAVAGAVRTARKAMEALYADFTRVYGGMKKQHEEDLKRLAQPQPTDQHGNKTPVGVPGENASVSEVALRAKKQEYDQKARNIMKPLASAAGSNWALLNEGSKFQGPTNAVDPVKSAMNTYFDKLAGGGGLPRGLTGPGGGSAAAKQKLQQLEAQQLAQQQAAQRQLLEQLAAQQAAEKAAQEAAQRELEAQQAAQRQLGTPGPIPVPTLGADGAPIPSLVTFPGGGPGTAPGGTGRPALGRPQAFEPGLPGEEPGLTPGARALLGRPGLLGTAANGLNGPGGFPGMGSPGLRGRLGEPGRSGAPGSPPPLGGRRDPRTQAGGQPGGVLRPESEEYLAGTPRIPAQMSAELVNGPTPGSVAPRVPRSTIPGRPGTGGTPTIPGQPGPMSRNRSMTPEDLAGRRRSAGAEPDEDLMAPPTLTRPDLTGRKGLPVVDWEEIGGRAVGAEPSLLGSRGPGAGPAEPGMAERLAGRRRDQDTRDGRTERPRAEEPAREETGSELWTVETPTQIEPPTEQKVEQSPGLALGS